MDRFCEACQGTGRFEARFGGPDWPLCPSCMGSGRNERMSTIDDRRSEVLNRALEKIKSQEELLNFIQDEFLAALSALTAATSSYEHFTGNANSRGKKDPLYNTKLSDYKKAVEQSRAAYEEFQNRLTEIKKRNQNW